MAPRKHELCFMALRKLSLVVFVVLLASYHPTAAIERVNETILKLWNYKGCYRLILENFATILEDSTLIEWITLKNSAMYLNVFTLIGCRKECIIDNYYGIGIMIEEMCFCLKSFEDKVVETKCDKLCSDGFPCGGNKFISLYEKNTVIPVGCFSGINVQPRTVMSSIPSDCVETCFEHMYKYSTFNSSVCICGNDFTTENQMKLADCDDDKRIFKLFDVSLETEKHNISTIYQYCLNNVVESKKSYCTSTVCLPGWSGKLCNQKGMTLPELNEITTSSSRTPNVTDRISNVPIISNVTDRISNVPIISNVTDRISNVPIISNVTDGTDVETPASDPITSCEENNGGCGEDVCVEVQGDVFDVQVKCNPPDEEIFTVPEVYENSSLDKPKSDWNYKGCFNKVQSSKELMIISVKSCFEYCKETSFYAMNIKRFFEFKKFRMVGYAHVPTVLRMKLVPTNAIRNVQMGCRVGEKSNQSIAIGCFKYLELEHKHDQLLSKAFCLDKCKELGFPYSGTRDETCQCGRKIEFKDQLNKEQCEEPSVFALLSDVSPDLDAQGKPTKYNYCMNDKIESKQAYCKTGHCKIGWTGALCDKRNCGVNNGDCGKEMMCVQEIVNNIMFEKCLCGKGFVTTIESQCKKQEIMREDETDAGNYPPGIVITIIIVCPLLISMGIGLITYLLCKSQCG
ncbi:hypothetical protein HELRODRAFT_177731 [Helobdella robusta]|uniref:WSC domain-containing protein n=1 Tax=Helobdella robusta TaxID=6412 RepID=T1FC54_HELRO|nr:hypothetical protein HELRODRAFT_177731 [Helobdella robusta]ESN97676.1 hypothetical protein HELRODRAFT_177731 [Helobdella robusta]